MWLLVVASLYVSLALSYLVRTTDVSTSLHYRLLEEGLHCGSLKGRLSLTSSYRGRLVRTLPLARPVAILTLFPFIDLLCATNDCTMNGA